MRDSIIRYGLVPAFLLGGNGLGIWFAHVGAPVWQRLLGIALAIGAMLLAERVLPYAWAWNRDHGDQRRDVWHALVNSSPLAGNGLRASTAWHARPPAIINCCTS